MMIALARAFGAHRQGRAIAARAMAPDSSRKFGEQDFVTSHRPWSFQSSDFVKKIKFCFA